MFPEEFRNAPTVLRFPSQVVRDIRGNGENVRLDGSDCERNVESALEIGRYGEVVVAGGL